MAFSPSHSSLEKGDMVVDEPPPLEEEEEADFMEVEPPPSKGGGGADARHWPMEVEQLKSLINCPKTLLIMCHEYDINVDKYMPLCAEDGWGPCKTPPKDSVCVYKDMLEVGVRFPLHPFYTKILQHYDIAPSQLMPNAWRYMVGFVLRCEDAGIRPTVPVFRYYFKMAARSNSNLHLHGWYCFISYSKNRRLFIAESSPSYDGWKKFYFFLQSRLAETAWRCPTKWGTPNADSHKPPVLDEAAKEAIKKLDTRNHKSDKSLQSVLFQCNKLPVLPPLELELEGEKEVKEEGTTSPPPKFRAMSSIADLPPQQQIVVTTIASSSLPPPELATPNLERPVRAHPASQMFTEALDMVRRMEEDLHRAKNELREEKSKHVADVAQLNRVLGASKAELSAQVDKVEGLKAAKAKAEAKVCQLIEELSTEKIKASQLAEDLRVAKAKHAASQLADDLRVAKAKHAGEVKALNDEWLRKVVEVKCQSHTITGVVLRETRDAVLSLLTETRNVVQKSFEDRLTSYPSIEPTTMQSTPPLGCIPHQANHAAIHQTINGTNQTMQDHMNTTAILKPEALPTGFPPHQAPEHQ